jgi:hypothetical protein
MVVTKAKKGANVVRPAPRSKGGNGETPRAVYKFTKRGRNCGPVLASEKRDRSTYDYSDEI